MWSTSNIRLNTTSPQLRLLAWKEKERELLRELAKHPGNMRCLMSLGRHYSNKKKVHAARACFEKVQKHNSQYQLVGVETVILHMARWLSADTRTKVVDILSNARINTDLEIGVFCRLMTRYLARARNLFVPWSQEHRDVYTLVEKAITSNRLWYMVSPDLAHQLLLYSARDCTIQARLSAQNIPTVIYLRNQISAHNVAGLENPIWDELPIRSPAENTTRDYYGSESDDTDNTNE